MAHGHRQPGQAARAGRGASRSCCRPALPYDPLAQARALVEVAQAAPKGVKWKLRANMGDRVRWYELPEEVDH